MAQHPLHYQVLLLLLLLHWLDTGSGQSLQSFSAVEPSHRFPDVTFVIPNYQLGFILKSFALITLTAALGSQWLRLTNHSTQKNILNICLFT